MCFLVHNFFICCVMVEFRIHSKRRELMKAIKLLRIIRSFVCSGRLRVANIDRQSLEAANWTMKWIINEELMDPLQAEIDKVGEDSRKGKQYREQWNEWLKVAGGTMDETGTNDGWAKTMINTINGVWANIRRLSDSEMEDTMSALNDILMDNRSQFGKASNVKSLFSLYKTIVGRRAWNMKRKQILRFKKEKNIEVVDDEGKTKKIIDEMSSKQPSPVEEAIAREFEKILKPVMSDMKRHLKAKNEVFWPMFETMVKVYDEGRAAKAFGEAYEVAEAISPGLSKSKGRKLWNEMRKSIVDFFKKSGIQRKTGLTDERMEKILRLGNDIASRLAVEQIRIVIARWILGGPKEDLLDYDTPSIMVKRLRELRKNRI